MDDNRIYELLENSFGSDFKPDFNDVKKRIAAAAQPEKRAPQKINITKIIKIVSAAAACLVFAAAIGFVVSSTGSSRSEDSSVAKYDMYNESAKMYEEATTEASNVCDMLAEDTECADLDEESDSDISDSDISPTDE